MAEATFAGVEFTFNYTEPCPPTRDDPGEGWLIEDVDIVSVDEAELTRYLNAGHTLHIEDLEQAAVDALEAGHAD